MAPSTPIVAVIPLTTLFIYGKNHFGILQSAIGVGFLAFGIAMLSLRFLEETYSKDLDYTEMD